MRKAFLHERILLDPFEQHFRTVGAAVERESPVTYCGHPGFIDLLVQVGPCRIAIEGELTPTRLLNDLNKAIASQATWLLVVTPTPSIAARCLRVLRPNIGNSPIGRICVLPLGMALRQVRVCFPLNSTAFPAQKANQEGNPCASAGAI